MKKINVIISMFLLAVVFTACNDQTIELLVTTSEQQATIDSLVQQNSNIVNLNDSLLRVNQKLASLIGRFDTMPVEYQLYEQDIYLKALSAENDAYDKKDSAEMKAYTTKDKAERKIWDTYYEQCYNALKLLSKKDPDNFNKYAIYDFWQMHSTNNSYKYYDLMSNMEKTIPSFKEYQEIKELALSVLNNKNDLATQQYSSQIKLINQKYESKKELVWDNYKQLLEKKKLELGLVD